MPAKLLLGVSRYKSRFPDTWESEVHRKLQGPGGLMPITVMMDHVVASKAAYKGTEHENTFFIFHDALSQWWEDEAQDYLSTIFDVSRQLRLRPRPQAQRRRLRRLNDDLAGELGRP